MATVDFSQYFTVWQRADGSGRHVVALHSNVSYAGDSTPVFERYYAGGFRSIRGFAFRGVGPTIDNFKVGGDFQLLNSVEYQVPVQAGDNIYLVGFVVFFDGGMTPLCTASTAAAASTPLPAARLPVCALIALIAMRSSPPPKTLCRPASSARS